MFTRRANDYFGSMPRFTTLITNRLWITEVITRGRNN